MPSFNLSELFESVVDAVPDRVAIASPGRRLTYAELDERSNRLAHHLSAQGIGAGDHVGLQLLNGTEYLEGMLAAFKLRAVPVNVNHRYVERELVHLFDDADLVALVVHGSFTERVAKVAGEITTLRHIVVVDDGTEVAAGLDVVDYEEALAAASPDRGFDRAQRRRPLHRVHRRHHRHAQGRPLASRGPLLRGARRRRPHAGQGPAHRSRRPWPIGCPTSR